jgi:thioredoxin-related protein
MHLEKYNLTFAHSDVQATDIVLLTHCRQLSLRRLKTPHCWRVLTLRDFVVPSVSIVEVEDSIPHETYFVTETQNDESVSQKRCVCEYTFTAIFHFILTS